MPTRLPRWMVEVVAAAAAVMVALLLRTRRVSSFFLSTTSSSRLLLKGRRGRRRTTLPGRRGGATRWISSPSSSSDAAAGAAASEVVAPPLVLPSHPELGALRSVAAPMVAASDYAFRCLCRQSGGVDLTFTQMLHCRGLLAGDGAAAEKFVATHADFYECSRQPDGLLPSQRALLLDGGGGGGAAQRPPIPDHWRRHATGPLIVQLAGNDVEQVQRAADLVLDRTGGRLSGIDLNLGCPQAIARRGNYGAFLAEQRPEIACDVLRALRRTLPERVAVSAKIRLPLDPTQQEDRIKRLVDTGINFLTVHGRTVRENKTAVGAVHANRIRDAVATAADHGNVPVIANGGIECKADVERMLQQTGAAAVMSSEGLLETPNLFQTDSSRYSPRQMLEQQFQITRDYLTWCRCSPPLPGVLGAAKAGSMTIVRSHVVKFLYRYLQEHADLRRHFLESHTVQSLDRAEGFLNDLHARYADLSDEELLALPSGRHPPASSWYRRHWEAAAHRVHRKERPGGAGGGETAAQLSVDERKELLRKRIAKLQERRMEKVAVAQ